jgi:predicted Zn-dependent peptidase
MRTQTSSPAAPRINRSELDGIPVFWADCSAGPFTAGLVVRVGRADETLATAGVSHLVEHLALSGIEEQPYDHNGEVDSDHTIFYATGSPAEVTDFFHRTAAGLRSLPTGRIELERRVLKAESEGREGSVNGAVRWYRFGPVGHGLLGQPEFGLEWLGEEQLAAWVSSRYTVGNAALWLTGPVPPDLHLELPAGERVPLPKAEPLPHLRFPTYVREGGPGVAVSFLVPRSSAVRVGFYVAERRLRQRLRFEQGLVYDVAVLYEPLDEDMAQVLIGCDCPDKDAAAVRDAILATCADLAERGATGEEMAREVDQHGRELSDPLSCPGQLEAAAMSFLTEAKPRLPLEVYADQQNVTPEDVRRAIAEALPTMLLLFPTADAPPTGFHPYPDWSERIAAGQEFRPPGLSLFGTGPKERLYVGREGVTLVFEPGNQVTVLYAECEALECAPDGCRLLWGRDCFRVLVEPEKWRNGQEAVAMIDAAVPADRRVPVERISFAG